MTNTVATVAARPAALAAPSAALCPAMRALRAAGRKARRPRFASVTAAISALLGASAAMDPADALMAKYAAASTADYVRMQLLSRAIDGDVWASALLAGALPVQPTMTADAVVAAAKAQAASYMAAHSSP